jgi:hypothetical protein
MEEQWGGLRPVPEAERGGDAPTSRASARQVSTGAGSTTIKFKQGEWGRRVRASGQGEWRRRVGEDGGGARRHAVLARLGAGMPRTWDARVSLPLLRSTELCTRTTTRTPDPWSPSLPAPGLAEPPGPTLLPPIGATCPCGPPHGCADSCALLPLAAGSPAARPGGPRCGPLSTGARVPVQLEEREAVRPRMRPCRTSSVLNDVAPFPWGPASEPRLRFMADWKVEEAPLA